MKKEYMKPTMKVVELQQHAQILAGSVGGYGGQTIGTYRGTEDIITDDDYDTLF